MPLHRRLLRLDISRRAQFASLLVVGALVVAACGAPTSPSAIPSPGATAGPTPADALRVVATTTVLADLVAQVGGDRVSVTSLVPKGGEVHTFDPSPSDLARVAEADLIVMNGLGLDEWLGRLVGDSGATTPIVELAEDLEGVDYLEGGHEDEDDHGDEDDEQGDEDDHGDEVNPHLWLNVQYAALYVDRIAEALAAADPDHATIYESRAANYAGRLAELDGWVRQQIESIPEEHRKVVSFHEAFPYLAAAYGLEIVGTVVDAPGQDPSAGRVAALVREIRDSGARAVFAEAQFGDQLAQTVADEAGVVVVTDLYNDSLGDPPVDTYEGMMRWNIERIVSALR
jgi:manganese/iron transport system substrate-binding protein